MVFIKPDVRLNGVLNFLPMSPKFHKGFNILPMKNMRCLGLPPVKKEENRLIFNGKDERDNGGFPPSVYYGLQ